MPRTRNRNTIVAALLAAAMVLVVSGGARDVFYPAPATPTQVAAAPATDAELQRAAAEEGELVSMVGDGLPDFGADSGRTDAFETYAPLDGEGRCGAAYANVCDETLPTRGREPISSVRPSGWDQAYYSWVEGGSLYNRCHLIAFQLTGEDANEENLVTGTRTMNAVGMLPYEEEVGDHVRSTGHHVLYRATPLFEGDERVCRGVRLEARCVEGDGELAFDVFCHNVEPGVAIDYATGESWADGSVHEGSAAPGSDTAQEAVAATAGGYVVNVRSGLFHRPDCPGLAKASPKNLVDGGDDRAALVAQGYAPCSLCEP